MKKFCVSCSATIFLVSFLFCSCNKYFEKPKMSIDSEQAKTHFSKSIEITPMDESVFVQKNQIEIAPTEENQIYTISGYFLGQIVVKTKNTSIKLNNAFLENASGNPAIICLEKTEISTAKDSENYIVSFGGFSSNAAIQCKKDVVFGGSGKLYVKGRVCHGIEAEDAKIKGSGAFYFEGTKNGSALKCDSFSVEDEKTFSAYFINSKNGIKANETIEIASGNFYFYNNQVALKTDSPSKDTKKNHFIKLTGGTFSTYKNAQFYVTKRGAFSTVVEVLETTYN